MIFSRNPDIAPPGFVAPAAGIKATALHLEKNNKLFDRFVSSIMALSAPDDDQFAISVERQQIKFITYRTAMSMDTPEYFFFASLPQAWHRADVRTAMDYGVLPYLASIHLYVMRINSPQRSATIYDLQAMLNKIDADMRMIIRILSEVQAINEADKSRAA
jgi:hypothetical protein